MFFLLSQKYRQNDFNFDSFFAANKHGLGWNKKGMERSHKPTQFMENQVPHQSPESN